MAYALSIQPRVDPYAPLYIRLLIARHSRVIGNFQVILVRCGVFGE